MVKGRKSEGEFSPHPELADLYARVQGLIQARKTTAKWLYERIGMTKTGYRQMWEAGSVKLLTLNSMAKAFDMDRDQLLDMKGDDTSPAKAQYPTPSPSSTTAEPAPKLYLEQRVEKLEAVVAALQKRKG